MIGNPPYGAKLSDEDKRTFKKTYRSAQTIKGKQKGSLDTYSLFIELGYNLSHRNGISAFIVPMGITSSEAMTGLHHILLAGCESIEVSSYGDRPRRIFDSAEQQVSIILFRKGRNDALTISTTSINKRNASQSIDEMIEKLSFTQIEIAHIRNGRIPKLGSDTEGQILKKMLSHTVTFEDFFLSKGAPVYYRKAGGRYYKVITITPTNSSAEGALIVPPAYQKTFAAIMSSSLFYWFWLTHSDWHNLRLLEIAWFPLPHLSDEILSLANRLYDEYQEDLLAKSQLTTTGLRCYYARKSKTFIDRIDDLICPLYGLTEEETEFIKNYEIEFRLSDES